MSCNQGFTLMNGHCNTTSSVPNCLRQVSATCESCLGGFFLRANICQTQCSILCRSCNSPSPADCSTCQSSAYFSSNTCTPLLSFSETVAQ